jgi:oxygen-dependent protoporphyrinogen oxidase
LEASARFGGKLISEHRDGFVVEGAADGFLARKPPALAWSKALGLEAELVEPRPEHRFSQVLWAGKFHRMPEGFSGLVPTDPEGLRRTSLLTTEGVERAVAEPKVPPRTAGAEESVEQFFTRRYGREAFERLMEPLLAGIYAGDASRLSVEAAFPQLVALERGGQSLTDGLNAAPRPDAGPAFRSFAGGMARLPAAFAAELERLGASLIAGSPVTALERDGDGFVVRTARDEYPADAVVVALPPLTAAGVLSAVSPEQGAALAAWPVSSVANLNLAFDENQVSGLPAGSGFVAPRAGGSAYSAATWSSRKWPGRAPAGKVLVRVYFGGARDPQGWKAPEADLVDASLALLASFHDGRRPTPLWIRLFRWKDAFAQPNLGQAERHRALDAARVPGLVLAGGYFSGPGIPDCLARSDDAAADAAAFLASRHPFDIV